MNITTARRGLSLFIATLMTMLLSGCTILHGREQLGVPIRTVVLTFDDGPNENLGATAELLDVLAKHKVPAAFCVVGEQVTAHPDLVRRMAAEGHLIVNHTDTHFTPFTKMPDAVMEEFRLCDAAIGDALGIADYRSTYFRPPVGLMTFGLKSRLKEEGLVIAPVTTFVRDTTTSASGAAEIRDRLIGNIRHDNGGIIILHDRLFRLDNDAPDRPGHKTDRRWVAQVIDDMITELRAEGYTFQRLDSVRLPRG
jgi:peptidoglycan/xylan/chitin deacetylase (PgdA/CDA1 family)